MNILIIQEAGRHDRNKQFREALNLQRAFSRLNISCTVWGKGYPNFSINFSDIEKECDIILLLENYNSGWVPDLSSYSKPKFFWSIDAHWNLKEHLDTVEKNKIKFVLSSTDLYCKEFKKLRVKNSLWFPNAYPSDLIDIRQDVQKSADVGFCGNVVNRGNWIQSLGLKHDNMVLGEDMVRAVCSYKIHWNMNISQDINYRTWETLGCGTFLLTNYTDRLGDLCSPWEHLVTYDSLQDCQYKIKYYLEHDEEREVIAKAGYEHAKKWHTYNNRAKLFLDLLNQI